MMLNQSSVQRLYSSALIIFFIIAIIQGVSLKALYADGSTLILDLLTQQHILRWDYSRQMAHLLTQMPTIVLIWLGMKNVYLLTFVYGFTLAMQPFLTFYTCLRLLRNHHAKLIPWFLLVIILLQINAGLYISTESLTGSYFFCIIIALFIHAQEKLTLKSGILLFVMTLCIPRLFEGYFIFSPLLIILTLWRYPSIFHPPYQMEKILYLFFILANFIAIAISGYAIYSAQRNLFQFNTFTDQIGSFQLPYALSGLLLLIFVSMLIQWIYDQSIQRHFFFHLMIVCTGIGIGIYPFIENISQPEMYNDGTRFLAIMLPASLLAVFIYQYRIFPTVSYIWKHYIENRSPQLNLLLTAVIVWNMSWQISTSYQWRNYIHQMHVAIHIKQGPITLESTNLLQHPFTKSWSAPSLGLLIAAILDRKISSILIPPPGIWQPFSAKDYHQWPDLRHYGIVYAPIWHEQSP